MGQESYIGICRSRIGTGTAADALRTSQVVGHGLLLGVCKVPQGLLRLLLCWRLRLVAVDLRVHIARGRGGALPVLQHSKLHTVFSRCILMTGQHSTRLSESRTACSGYLWTLSDYKPDEYLVKDHSRCPVASLDRCVGRCPAAETRCLAGPQNRPSRRQAATALPAAVAAAAAVVAEAAAAAIAAVPAATAAAAAATGPAAAALAEAAATAALERGAH
jgi:hypothetical protein